jgi:hypothetical protein
MLNLQVLRSRAHVVGDWYSCATCFRKENRFMTIWTYYRGIGAGFELVKVEEVYRVGFVGGV